MNNLSKRSQEVLCELEKLVSFDSVNGNENMLSNYLVERFAEMGMHAVQQESSNGMKNAIGSVVIGSGGKTILLNSHMDVVDAGEGWVTDPFQLTMQGTRAYGRGATDAKGALAGLIVAAKRIMEDPQGLNGTILLTAVVNEEQNSFGARTLCESGIQADYAIVGEPTMSQIGVCHNGSIRPVIVIKGRSAHSAAPELGISAIRVAAYLSAKVDEIADEIRDVVHPLTGSPSISITLIKGGRKENMIPDCCEVVIDRRMVPCEKEADIIARLELLCKDVEAAFPGAKVAIDHYLVTTGPASEMAEDSEIVQTALAARKCAIGDAGEMIGLICNTDMNSFVRCGIPTVIIGPGTIKIAHMPNEYVEIEQLGKASLVQEAVIRELLK